MKVSEGEPWTRGHEPWFEYQSRSLTCNYRFFTPLINVWGSLIPPNVQRHLWTKLELENQPAGEAAKVLGETSSTALGLHKQPVDIIADCSGQVKAHFIQNLDQKYGQKL